MTAAPWICRNCTLRIVQPLSKRFIRLQSTLEAAISESVPPALLTRARTVALEHKQLAAKLNDGFDTRIAKKLGEYSPIVNALGKWDKANESVTELTSLIHDSTTDPELRELAADDLIETREQLSAASQSLITALVPVHPFAHLPCLLELRPGAGGSEAAIFAGDLFRMYLAFCNRNGFRTNLLKYENINGTSEAGVPLSEAVLEVENDNAYGVFRCEAGVHRVQRVPATETKGRTHTSAVSVHVLPSLQENNSSEENFDDPDSDYYIDVKEVKVEVMRASGAGGQHVNKTESAVRLTHLPTNTVVAMQDSRSQHKNKEKAWALLRSRIAQSRREQREEEISNMRRSVIGVAKMGRGDKVRTYNWGQQRVTDHRSGLTVHDLDDVMEGGQNLEKVMESVRSWLMERDVEALIAEEGQVK
ncbi:similar to peptide chain release factor 1 [Plenodomus lingam JN3]|uniref:Similar to peptide chain release factor 1 n=1 Tax=Leptosphaeria maculans (strain JN3 / isolate v23.1.3 / race Av1-4-5-6-7-8) TaxID=985895 RepID=E5A9Z3_LEPMJ|nr:similar to peptide chain release factor 1 [Plenodomus lingam JN3]CBY00484.1 similar to peptide chain release factor 1 [Plenodomus lingam JN3]